MKIPVLLKKKTFYIALLSLTGAIALAVYGIKSDTSVGVISRFEDAVNTRNEKKILSTFEPDIRKELKKEFEIKHIEDIFSLATKKHKISILYKESQSLSDDENYDCICLITLDNKVERVYEQQISVKKDGKKKYISKF